MQAVKYDSGLFHVTVQQVRFGTLPQKMIPFLWQQSHRGRTGPWETPAQEAQPVAGASAAACCSKNPGPAESPSPPAFSKPSPAAGSREAAAPSSPAFKPSLDLMPSSI